MMGRGREREENKERVERVEMATTTTTAGTRNLEACEHWIAGEKEREKERRVDCSQSVRRRSVALGLGIHDPTWRNCHGILSTISPFLPFLVKREREHLVQPVTPPNQWHCRYTGRARPMMVADC